MALAATRPVAGPTRSGWHPADRSDSGGCDRSDNCSGSWRTPGRCRPGRQALRCDTVQSRASPGFAQPTAGRQTAPDTPAHSGERSRRASPWHASGQLLQGSGCLLLDLVREMGVDRGGGRGAMPEPDLDYDASARYDRQERSHTADIRLIDRFAVDDGIAYAPISGRSHPNQQEKGHVYHSLFL